MGSALEELLGSVVLSGDKQQVPVLTLSSSGKVLGLYFSAHWCPPCRGFTPRLVEFYEKMKERLEVVFISSDKDEAGWTEYFADMPWLALPFSDRTRKEKVCGKFSVRGIPTLILIDAETGAVIQAEGRELVGKHPDGEGFPWAGVSPGANRSCTLL